MVTFILAGAFVVAAILAGVIAVVLIRAAFSTEADVAKEVAHEAVWRPAFVQGHELHAWAAATADRVARGILAEDRNPATAARLVEAVQNGAAHAMLPLARPAELERVVPCPAAGQGTIAVTAPEALAIADHLRRTCSRREQFRILNALTQNAARRHWLRRHGGDETPLLCALQGRDRVCVVFGTRPLRCRALHAATVARSAGPGVTPAGPPKGKAADAVRHEQAVVAGVEDGFRRALSANRLDAEMYEIDDALAVALRTPDAASRWARGEAVFASCQMAAAPAPRGTSSP
jgi:hypothetical protein